MNEYAPSYAEYRRILEDIKRTGKLMDYRQAKTADEFIVLRHDIEFSVEKAARMAEIERQHNVQSSYFVQVGSSAYNPFSERNKSLLRQMVRNGHKIGLHYRQTDGSADISQQARLLADELGIQVDRFSCHRPKRETRYEILSAPGLMNAYSCEFFTRTDDPEVAEVKYISDSGAQWNYGYPDAQTLTAHAKVQLLIHPFSWSEEGGGLEAIFKALMREAEEEHMATFRNELKRFKEVEEAVKRG